MTHRTAAPARLVQLLAALLAVLILPSPTLPQGKTRKWTEVQSPHFVIVTDGNEKQGQRLAGQFEAIRSVFEQTLKLRVESGKPFIVMGFRDEKSMRAALPRFWEKKGQSHPAGVFMSGGDKIYVAIDLEAGGDNPYSVVYHEYTHMVLRLNVRSLPLWMREGLAEFYGNSTIGEREVSLGRPDIYSIQTLRQGKLVPLTELFRVTGESPQYNRATKVPMFYAESWALVHYLMLGEKTEAGQRNRLFQFLTLLRQGVSQDEATRQVFDDSADLQGNLMTYVSRSAFRYIRIKTKTADTPGDFVARVLSPAETAARLGDFALHDRRLQDAKPLLEEALRLQPDLASAQESLGFLFMRQGDRAEALRWFDRAIAGDSKSFMAHYYHATLTLNETDTPEGSARAAASLEKAIQLNPSFVPAYIALARLYLGDDKTVERALVMARQAAALEPGSFSNQMMLGNALVRAGRYEEALRLAKALEQSASSPTEKSMVQAFLEDLTRFIEKKDPGSNL